MKDNERATRASPEAVAVIAQILSLVPPEASPSNPGGWHLVDCDDFKLASMYGARQ